jgi:hypothetical protein
MSMPWRRKLCVISLSRDDKHAVTITAHADDLWLMEIVIVLAQYVHPSNSGLFRIVQHGHRWRALLDDREMGRHGTAEAALVAVRAACPRARVPATLRHWRQLPEPARLHARAPCGLRRC